MLLCFQLRTPISMCASFLPPSQIMSGQSCEGPSQPSVVDPCSTHCLLKRLDRRAGVYRSGADVYVERRKFPTVGQRTRAQPSGQRQARVWCLWGVTLVFTFPLFFAKCQFLRLVPLSSAHLSMTLGCSLFSCFPRELST